MELDIFKDKILDGCRQLKDNDHELFELNHHEETINHRLALYFTALFQGYHVDVEYSLNEQDLKKNKTGAGVRPDIVIHERGNNSSNLAVIEIKRSNNGSSDKKKIENYSNLNYKYGVRIKLNDRGGLNSNLSKVYDFSSENWFKLLVQ